MELWLNYLEASVESSIVMICILLMSLIFNVRYRKKYRIWVWMLIMFRLLVPMDFQLWNSNCVVEFPMYTIAEYIAETEEITEESISGIHSEQAERLSGNKYEIRITTGTVMVLFWEIGAVWFLGYHFFTHRHSCKKLKNCSYTCEEEGILQQVVRIAEEVKLNKLPTVRIIQGTKNSPFSKGIIKATIYLPEIPYEEKDLNYILRHEIIHCKNRDVLVKVVMLIVNAIHWFNPLVWMMRVLLNYDMELVCDEEVLIKASKEECREYSEIILSYIGTKSKLMNMVSTGYVQGTKFIKYRFENIFETNKKKGGSVCVALIVILLLLFQGKVQVVAKEIMEVVDVPIHFGMEIKADVDGDGKNDRIYVKDKVGNVDVNTQLVVQFADGEADFVTYPDYWGSYLISGDLDNDGTSDIVLMRGASGNAYGMGYVNVLHIVDGQWEEYPNEFIENPSIRLNQPEDFAQKPLGDVYVAATIIEKDERTMLRLIRNEDIGNDIVSCIDCFWTGAGWQIEEMQIIEKYYEEYKDLELLENHYIYE